jgi:hypothetical protein
VGSRQPAALHARLTDRQQQTIRYLQDVQAPLAVALSKTSANVVSRYVHGPTGIHARQNHQTGAWLSILQDSIGSVHSPYGVPLGVMAEIDYCFTGKKVSELIMAEIERHQQAAAARLTVISDQLQTNFRTESIGYSV